MSIGECEGSGTIAIVGTGNATAPSSKIFWSKLGQIRLNLDEIKAKFRQLIRFGQIKIPLKHSISYTAMPRTFHIWPCI